MIEYYKTINGKISKIDTCEEGCWVNCVEPSEHEINFLISNFDIEPEFIRSSLDEEESSHIDSEDNVTLIMIDSPVV